MRATKHSAVLLLVLLPGCAALKNGVAAGVGDGPRVEMLGAVNAAVELAVKAQLDNKQDAAGAGDGQRVPQTGVANFAIENEMSIMLAVILLSVLVLMGFDKLLGYRLQRLRIKNDAMEMAARYIVKHE